MNPSGQTYLDPLRSNTDGNGNEIAIRTEHLYTAVVLCHGGNGHADIFIGSINQPVPVLSGSSTNVLPNHQSKYTLLTTPYVQAGQGGGTIGDAAVEAFGATVEQAPYSNGGVLQPYGAGPLEMSEILAKVAIEIILVNNEQIRGPLFLFPCMGGVVGAIAFGSGGVSTTTANLVTYLTNGVPGTGRQLVAPIPIGRNDTLRGTLSLPASGDSLVFSTTGTTSSGQGTLIWVSALASVTSHLRG